MVTVPRSLRYIVGHHNCRPDNWPTDLQVDDAGGTRDLIHWPVELYGRGVPEGVPFTCYAQCPACHDWLEQDFVWGSWRHLATRTFAEEA